MDGMLSQDEINALLNGMASGEIIPEPTPEPVVESAPVQEEKTIYPAVSADQAILTDVEKDAIGEIANISMGTSATTLYSLVNNKVDITTPVVSMVTWEDLMTEKERPCVFIQINYTAGLDGNNILILREHDVKIITDLMMGGDGTNIDGELGELHLSAICEAMNQMMGSSATSLSQMLGKMIDISPPSAKLMSVEQAISNEGMGEFLKGTFVRISFQMQIGDLVDSTILQLYPVDFAKEVVATFLGGSEPESEPVSAPEPVVEAYTPPVVDAQQPTPQAMPNMGMPMQNMGMQGMNMSGMGMPDMSMAGMGMNPMMGMPGMGMAGMAQPNMGMNPMMGMSGMNMPGMNPMMGGVSYQPAQFEAFNPNVAAAQSNENISLIMDVPLEVTVELGRTTKSISEILDFTPGTIIELDKIAGEPIDVLVNGKFVAKGEVVVIEESFGIRVTEIIK